jgi:hypothetical protein
VAAEEWQHEKRNALMVKIARAAALADCGFPEKPAIKSLITKDTRNFFSEIPNPPILRVRISIAFRKVPGWYYFALVATAIARCARDFRKSSFVIKL